MSKPFISLGASSEVSSKLLHVYFKFPSLQHCTSLTMRKPRRYLDLMIAQEVGLEQLRCDLASKIVWSQLQGSIDFVSSLKDFYYNALDKLFWEQMITHRRDPENDLIPVRPNPNDRFNPWHSSKNRNHENPQPLPNRPHPTPLRQRRQPNHPRGPQPREGCSYNPVWVGIR